MIYVACYFVIGFSVARLFLEEIDAFGVLGDEEEYLRPYVFTLVTVAWLPIMLAIWTKRGMR